MRLWTLHPSYLDARGLIAVWREALLAQKVLAGGTRGYRNHPQLIRFRATEDPAASIAAYLLAIADEGRHRGYALDVRRILTEPLWAPVLATTGQLHYEWEHLMAKLARRAPSFSATGQPSRILPHPLFHIVEGPIAEWEVGAGRGK